MSELRAPGACELEASQRCLQELATLIEELPRALEQALQAALPARPDRLGSVITTGIGASEPPARLLASLLVEGGVLARFCATSAFTRSEPPRGDLLVSFSQGLSPNALLPLSEPEGFRARWLVTSVGGSTPAAHKRNQRARLEAEGVAVVCLPPVDEPAWLVRIAGPTVAALGAFRLAAHLLGDADLLGQIEAAPDAYARGCIAPGDVGSPLPTRKPLGLITLGAPPESALAHRCKLMEALLVPEPPVWDVLQFAHGPLQAHFGAPLTLLTLEGPGDDALQRRLAATLAPGRHTLRRLIAPAAGPTLWFHHAAAIDQLLVSSLRAEPRDLYHWPGQRCDGPLYDLEKFP